MSSAVLLAFTPDANMRAVGEAVDAAGLALMLCGPGEVPSRGSLPSDRPLVLLAMGSEGGAALARWVGERGLDGVVGVGFVGVTAPWAEPWAEPFRTTPPTVKGLVAALEASRVYGGARVAHVALGPLEPLRGAAWRSRVGDMSLTDGTGSWSDGTPHEGGTACRRAYPLRFVVACATDDGVCAACSGDGASRRPCCEGPRCAACSGAGKRLSSADVARELVGDPLLAVTPDVACDRDVYGGIKTLQYESRDALAEHGLRDVVERLTR